MEKLKLVTETFAKQTREILGSNLVGIYLHGSAVMGCYHEEKSDIDLLVVIRDGLSEKDKLRYMDMVVDLNTQAPSKGMELSLIKQSVCKPFVYPTPYELHFSNGHLARYKANPREYVEKMTGTDKDLAAHITILYHRGQCLWGEAIQHVFEAVDEAVYFDSIWYDVEQAEEEILKNPVYMVLNLCRVLAFKKEKLILSKQEGGNWGLLNLPEKYHRLIKDALTDYTAVGVMNACEKEAKNFAAYMIAAIGNGNIPKL